MANQNRFCPLKVRVRGHDGVASLLSAFHECSGELRQLFVQMIDGGANIESQISRNLLIAATPAVQFVPRIAAD